MTRQLTLDLPQSPRFGREDFLVSPSNDAAWRTMEAWPDWPDNVLLLLGPTGSGKSHLAAIWAARARAQVLHPLDLAGVDPAAVLRSEALAIDDADRWGDETALFHLFNVVRQSQRFLVLTARTWPQSWGLRVPDLLSRLRQAPVVELHEPDDALVRAVLVKLFVDRQLTVDTAVVDYLAVRIERSLDAARAVVSLLDQTSLAERRAVTRPMAADVLRRMDASPSPAGPGD